MTPLPPPSTAAAAAQNGRMVRICFTLERFNTPLHVFVGTFLCASLRLRARSATAAGNGGSDGASPSPAAGSVLQKLNSHGPHHATRCVPHRAPINSHLPQGSKLTAFP